MEKAPITDTAFDPAMISEVIGEPAVPVTDTIYSQRDAEVVGHKWKIGNVDLQYFPTIERIQLDGKTVKIHDVQGKTKKVKHVVFHVNSIKREDTQTKRKVTFTLGSHSPTTGNSLEINSNNTVILRHKNHSQPEQGHPASRYFSDEEGV